MGRLFDTAAALLGFTHEITFEGQAAMWLEHMATQASRVEAYPFPYAAGELDFRPLLSAITSDRLRGRGVPEIARRFQLGIAQGIYDAAVILSQQHQVDTLALSGGVFQNGLLLSDVKMLFAKTSLQIWTNHSVPPNDGGISLGQAALAASATKSGTKQRVQLDRETTLV
jgi:hydrogenase maturation protein HypF